MNRPETEPDVTSTRAVLTVCLAAMIALAVAMGVGRFAFTPLFPLMVRDGLLGDETGAWLAAGNYFGYLVGALLAARVRLEATSLLGLGLIGTVAVTAAVGWTASVPAWLLLRFVAGVLSAWALVATSAWALGWLAAHDRPQLGGIIFAGVGLGIAAAGVFCLVATRPEVTAERLWVELAVLAGLASIAPLMVSRRHKTPSVMAPDGALSGSHGELPHHAGGLVICYGLFGFGYILPATYLPEMARQLVDDPRIFGWAWPVFGMAAAISAVAVSLGLQRFDRLNVWAASHFLMAAGVLLAAVWTSLAGIAIAALLVGGTVMVITMIAMQEARARAGRKATAFLARMTAGFAFGQLMGPVVSGGLGWLTDDYSMALTWALLVAAGGLIASGIYLRRRVVLTCG